MKLLISSLKALADPYRLQIMKLLEQRELCVCEIREALGIPQPTVSNHLKILEAAGFVISRREGLWVHYRLTANAEAHGYGRDLAGLVRQWLNDDQDVLRLLEKLPAIDRNLICGTRKNT